MRRCLAFAAAALAAAVLPGAAAVPQVEVRIEYPDDLLFVDEEMPVRLEVAVSCGPPPHPDFQVEVEPPTGNYFDLALAPLRWTYTASDCAAAPAGTLDEAAAGAFRFRRAMPPFRAVDLPVPAFLGDGTDVWTDAVAVLRATPDADLRVGALMGPPRTAERAGGVVVQEAEWAVTNHGTGSFHAAVEVRAKPDWMEVSVPARIASDGLGATFTMQARMPEACPAPSGVVELALVATSPEPRSSARSEPRVQGVVPCPPRPASAAALLAPVAAVLVAAFVARQRG